MAFSLDRTRSFIRIDEPNLISIHRSTSPIVPTVDCSQGHLCEAFICAAREYNLFRVYIGLYDSQLKSNFVFVADPVGFDSKNISILINEAETFLTSIGFCMERVNMEFSTATREVILRDLKVMREPSLAVRLDAAMLAIEELTEEKNELRLKASRLQKTYKVEIERLRQQIVMKNSAKPEVTVKPVLDDESVAALISERDLLRTEIANIRGELEAVRSEYSQSQMQKKKAELDKNSIDDMLIASKEESRVLQEEICVAREKLAAAEHEAEVARQEVLVLKNIVMVAQEEARIAKDETRCLLEKLSRAQEDISTAQAIYNTEVNSLQQGSDWQQSKLDSFMLEQNNEIKTLRAALAIADENLSYERAKNDSALQEMDALERNASVELKKLKKKVDSLSDEKRMLESMAAEMKVAANGEVERLQQINQSQRRAAIKKVKALKEEMRQLSEARAVMASPLCASFSIIDANKPSNSGCEIEKQSHFTDSEYSKAGFSNPFGLSGNTEPVCFEPDSTLNGIPYIILEDIVEVHRSFNKIQASPLGKRVQSCEGYVCLVKDLQHGLLVYVVWLMKDTDEVLVCRPDHITESENMVLEGTGYFERVGFIMDKLNLMTEPEQRQQQIDLLPFFHKIDMECAA